MAAPNPFVHAVYVAALAFQNRRRNGSEELYLTHVLDVAQALGPDATVSELSTAVLHDVLEDTDWTVDDLAESGVEGPSWKRWRYSRGEQRNKMRRSSLGSVRRQERSE